MGPVHYNGVKYVHATQGFRRADEVTREVVSQGQRAQREPQKAHHE